MTKPVIYQIIPRLYTNINPTLATGGTLEQNGVGKFNDFTPELLEAIKGLGATHVWYTGVIEHATATNYSAFGIRPNNPNVVKGKAGSPYAIKDYYDVDPDLAVDPANRMAEFEALLRRSHDAGLKVIIDFVPNHVARQYHSDAKPRGIEDLGVNDDTSLYFGANNNFYYIPRQLFSPNIGQVKPEEPYVEFPAKASGNDCFHAFPGACDWYETVKLNYGVDYGDGSRHFDPVPDTWLKMLHILRFWASKGVDGFRCDMVHMVPVEFWRWAIPAVKQHYPDTIFIGEIYDTGIYRQYLDAGFDYLYDKVNLYDTLRGIQCSNLSAAQLTNCWQRVEGIGPRMLNFLENHDEQRFGSHAYAGNPLHVAASLAVSAFLSTGPLMVYMGQELGEQGEDTEGFSGHDGRTTIFDYWSMSATRRWLSPDGRPDNSRLSAQQQALRHLYQRVMSLCNTEPAFARGAFFDLMYVNYDHPRSFNPHRQYAFLRSSGTSTVLVIANFDSRAAEVEVNIPQHAFDTLGIKPMRSAVATELLSDEKMRKPLNPDTPFRTTIPAYGAQAWRFVTRRR